MAVCPEIQRLSSESIASAKFQQTYFPKVQEIIFFGIKLINYPAWKKATNYGKYA
jgi:hypothetical protein